MNTYSELLTIRIEHSYFGGPIPSHEMEIKLADESRKLFDSSGLQMRIGDGEIRVLYSRNERDFAGLKSWYDSASRQAECAMVLVFEVTINNEAFYQATSPDLITGGTPLVFANFNEIEPRTAEDKTPGVKLTNLMSISWDSMQHSFSSQTTLLIGIALEKQGQDIFGIKDWQTQLRKADYIIQFTPLKLRRLYWIWLRENTITKIMGGLNTDDQLIIERNQNRSKRQTNIKGSEDSEISFELISNEETHKGRRAYKFLSSVPLVVTADDAESFCLNHVSKSKKRKLVERLPGPGSGTLDRMDEQDLKVTSIHVNI